MYDWWLVVFNHAGRCFWTAGKQSCAARNRRASACHSERAAEAGSEES